MKQADKTISITLLGEVPAKKNSRVNTRSGRSFPSRRHTLWHTQAALSVRAQSGGRVVENPCEISLVFVHGDLRRRDSDNGVSSVFDLLVDCGILKDDDWRRVRSFSVVNHYQKGKPRCIVEIKEIVEERDAC